MNTAVEILPGLTELVSFLRTGELVPGVFADDLIADFNVPSWRFISHGPADFAQQRHQAGPGPWQVMVEQAVATATGFVAEITHAHGDEHYRTLSLVTVSDGQITEFVHYCTGNWDAATLAAFAAG